MCKKRSYALNCFIRKLKFFFNNILLEYWVTQKLPQIHTANPTTFPIRIRKITVQICGNFWVTEYMRPRYSFDGWWSDLMVDGLMVDLLGILGASGRIP